MSKISLHMYNTPPPIFRNLKPIQHLINTAISSTIGYTVGQEIAMGKNSPKNEPSGTKMKSSSIKTKEELDLLAEVDMYEVGQLDLSDERLNQILARLNFVGDDLNTRIQKAKIDRQQNSLIEGDKEEKDILKKLGASILAKQSESIEGATGIDLEVHQTSTVLPGSTDPKSDVFPILDEPPHSFEEDISIVHSPSYTLDSDEDIKGGSEEEINIELPNLSTALSPLKPCTTQIGGPKIIPRSEQREMKDYKYLIEIVETLGKDIKSKESAFHETFALMQVEITELKNTNLELIATIAELKQATLALTRRLETSTLREVSAIVVKSTTPHLQDPGSMKEIIPEDMRKIVDFMVASKVLTIQEEDLFADWLRTKDSGRFDLLSTHLGVNPSKIKKTEVLEWDGRDVCFLRKLVSLFKNKSYAGGSKVSELVKNPQPTQTKIIYESRPVSDKGKFLKMKKILDF